MCILCIINANILGAGALRGRGEMKGLDLGICLESLSLEQTSTKFVLNAMGKGVVNVSVNVNVTDGLGGID